MTFLVERPQPGASERNYAGSVGYSRSRDAWRSAKADLVAALPFEIEVEGPEVRNSSYGSICTCETVYRIADAGVAWLKRYDLLRRQAGDAAPCVCDCMGKVAA